jgi:hypothetical protein
MQIYVTLLHRCMRSLVLILLTVTPLVTLATPHQTGLESTFATQHAMIDLPGLTLQAFTVRGNYAYASIDDGSSGFGIFDLSNPFSPTLTGQVSGPSFTSIVLSGTYAYLNTWPELTVIDVSVPTSPTIVATASLGPLVELALGNGMLYGAGVSHLRIIDISNPLSPTLVASYPKPHGGTILTVAGQMNLALFGVASDQYAQNGGLYLLDVSNPESPTEIGFQHTGDPFDLAVNGSVAFVASYSQVTLIDITNPVLPALIYTYTVPDSNPDDGIRVQRVASSNQYAYVAYGHYLYALDISNPAQPIPILSYVLADPIVDLALENEYAYATDTSGQLHVFHIPYRVFLPVVIR